MTDLLWIYLAALIIFAVLFSHGVEFFLFWLASRNIDDDEHEPIDLYVIDCTDVDNYLASTKEAEREIMNQLTEDMSWEIFKKTDYMMLSDPKKEKSIEREIKRLLK